MARSSGRWYNGYLLSSIACLAGIALIVFSRQRDSSIAGVPVPSWNLRLSSSGKHAGRALVYGRNSGLRIVRVQSGGARGNRASLLPSLADHEVWVVWLGRSRLQLQGDAGDPEAMRFGASGHLIKAYRDSRATGVRVW